MKSESALESEWLKNSHDVRMKRHSFAYNHLGLPLLKGPVLSLPNLPLSISLSLSQGVNISPRSSILSYFILLAPC